MGSWLDNARAVVAEVDKTLPADATLQDRKAALREAAYGAHWGTSWGQKTWQRARREYLEKHGEPLLKKPPFTRYSPIIGKREIVTIEPMPLFPEARS